MRYEIFAEFFNFFLKYIKKLFAHNTKIYYVANVFSNNSDFVMKNLKIFLKLFFSGFILAFMLSLLTHCPESNPIIPVDDETAVETPAIKQFSNDVIIAFESNDKQTVLDLMYDEYKDIYGEVLNTTPDKMQTFAKALKNRKIIYANDMYAEYEITIDGKVFTIAYSNTGEGDWKLHRF